jgi:hypothetical protein
MPTAADEDRTEDDDTVSGAGETPNARGTSGGCMKIVWQAEGSEKPRYLININMIWMAALV